MFEELLRRWDGEHAVVVSIAPGFGQPRPNRRGQKRRRQRRQRAQPDQIGEADPLQPVASDRAPTVAFAVVLVLGASYPPELEGQVACLEALAASGAPPERERLLVEVLALLLAFGVGRLMAGPIAELAHAVEIAGERLRGPGVGAEERIAVKRRECNSLVGQGEVEGVVTKLAKPQTFMNLSGEAVACLLAKENVDDASQHLVVISDDLALPFGTIRLRERGSAGGHNGLKSIISTIGTSGGSSGRSSR